MPTFDLADDEQAAGTRFKGGASTVLPDAAALPSSLRRGRPEATLRGQCGSRRLSPRWIGDRLPGSRSGASSRREQPPLPALAGFELIAEDVASHDGSLSTFR